MEHMIEINIPRKKSIMKFNPTYYLSAKYPPTNELISAPTKLIDVDKDTHVKSSQTKFHCNE